MTSLRAVLAVCATEWPNGGFIGAAVNRFKESESLELYPKDFDGDPNIDSSIYWQACARWALLSKFGGTNHHPGYIVTTGPTKRHVLQMEEPDVIQINREWNALLERRNSFKTLTELAEFLSNSTSNGKELQWAVMQCQASCQFRLHAHPNLELVYCVTGALFEMRRNDKGAWAFGTLNAGQWLVNETDSVHKSFTATNGDGCTLLVLWSGSHANLDELEGVQSVIDDVDKKLDSCDDCLDWSRIKETFLPPSEKGMAKAKQNQSA